MTELILTVVLYVFKVFQYNVFFWWIPPLDSWNVITSIGWNLTMMGMDRLKTYSLTWWPYLWDPWKKWSHIVSFLLTRKFESEKYCQGIRICIIMSINRKFFFWDRLFSTGNLLLYQNNGVDNMELGIKQLNPEINIYIITVNPEYPA